MYLSIYLITVYGLPAINRAAVNKQEIYNYDCLFTLTHIHKFVFMLQIIDTARHIY